nr:RcnB family protein [Paracoccus sp. PAR01]
MYIRGRSAHAAYLPLSRGHTRRQGLSAGRAYQGSGLVVDYRNHTLSEPKETQRWLLEPNAFLLVAADGTIVSVVRARYAGMAAR